jgi:hypothetical protein
MALAVGHQHGQTVHWYREAVDERAPRLSRSRNWRIGTALRLLVIDDSAEVAR